MDNDEITERVRENCGDLRARTDEARRVASAVYDDDQVVVALPRELALDLGRLLLQAVSPLPPEWRAALPEPGMRIDLPFAPIDDTKEKGK